MNIEFAGMMRIRNESRWIAEVLESIAPLCARIFVLDDHSTDDTIEICQRYPQVTVFNSHFNTFNEARDKNWLYDRVLEQCRPEYILCVDGDEVLEKLGPEIIRAHVQSNPCHAYSLQIIFLWNDRETARVDRIYGEFWRPSLFRPFVPDSSNPDSLAIAGELRFMATPFGRKKNGDEPNLHCSSVPQRLLHGHQRCPARLKHYGYLHRHDRVRKLDFYTGCDWLNQAEDCYRHMTQGDGVSLDELPITRQLLAEGKLSHSDVQYMIEAPPSARLVHAGPLELRAFAE